MSGHSDESFVEFVTASERDLRRTAFLLCGDWQQAEDAVQTALYKVYLHWRRIEAQGAHWSYARRAVINAVISESRRGWRRESVSDTLPDSPSTDGSEQVDDRLLLRQALRTLPMKQRSVVVLRYVHDLEVTEVAEVMRCPPGTVTSAAARALVALRTFLTRHGVVRGTTRKDA